MLNAGAGLLPDPPADIGTALVLNSNLQIAVENYQAINVINQFANIMSSAANLVNITGTIYNTEVVYGGTGYDIMGAPTPTFLPAPTGLYAVAATATATVSGSAINSVTMLDVGRGYEKPPEVFFIGGMSGQGASAVAEIKNQPGPLTNQTFQNLISLGSNTWPTLTNVLPEAYALGNVSFVVPRPTWQSGTVYNSGDIVGEIVLPRFDPLISYVISDQVTFAEKSYQAAASSQGIFPTDTNSWNEIDIPALYYESANTSQGVYPPGATASWTAVIDQYQLTQILLTSANAVMGQGDLTKFCQVFQSALAYRNQTNQTIRSCNNSAILDQTFDPDTGGMETLTTGGLNQLTANFTATSTDLSRLGDLINLGNLDDLGLPGELLAQIGRQVGGELAVVTDFLQAMDIPQDKIRALSRGNNVLTSSEEKSAYMAMTAVTGPALEQILLLLRVRVTGLVNMAQLLNPRLLFPESWRFLVCSSGTGLVNIFLPDGSTNSNLRQTLLNVDVASYSGPNNTNNLETMEKIIPADQALANKALARSLGQVKNIAQTTLPDLAAASAAVVGNDDLTLVQSQTTVVPPFVTESYVGNLANGSGPNGTLTLTDIIGVVAPDQYVAWLDQAADLLASIDTSALTPIFDNMQDVLDGSYGAPYGPITIPSGPGSGSYANLEDALQTLIPLAANQISILASAYPEVVVTTNQIWNDICERLQQQKTNLDLALIDFNNLAANSQTSSMAFTASLHNYALDFQVDTLLSSLANLASLSGQSVVASLREGRNLASLQNAGIRLDTQIDDR